MTPAADPLPQRAACVHLLTWLADEGRARRAGTQSSAVIATQSDMAVVYPQISDAILPRLLNSRRQSLDLKQWGWIYGPEAFFRDGLPELVPAVTLRWSWTGAVPNVHILVALLIAGNTAATGLDATAYRFESGHSGTTHDFDHVQPTLKMTTQAIDNLPGTRSPLNQTIPAFPLDSIGPVGIIICLLLSLYGRHRILRMLSQNPSLRQVVQPHMAQLPIFSRRLSAGSAPRGGARRNP
jgi:hypothetical protein